MPLPTRAPTHRPGRDLIFFLFPVATFGLAAAAGPLFALDTHPYFVALLATFAGVFGGGALALWSDRTQETSRRTREEARAAQLRQESDLAQMHLQLRVVGLLRDELAVSAAALRDPAARARRPRPDLFYTPLPLATWLALSASGELAHVPTPDLLGSFAEAYHWVGIINGYERHMLELQFDPAGVTGAFASAGAGAVALRLTMDRLRELLEGLDSPARELISAAIDRADEQFKSIRSRASAPQSPDRSASDRSSSRVISAP